MEENKKMSRWLCWLVAALVIVPSVGAGVPDRVHDSSPPHVVLDLSECTSNDGMACSEDDKEYVRREIIDPICGGRPGWACVTCHGEGRITVHIVRCGPPPSGCPPR